LGGVAGCIYVELFTGCRKEREDLQKFSAGKKGGKERRRMRWGPRVTLVEKRRGRVMFTSGIDEKSVELR